MKSFSYLHKLLALAALALAVMSILILSSAAEASNDLQATSRIILPYSAKVQITVSNAITNNCDGNFGIYSPIQQQLFANYNDRRGETAVLGPFDANTELVFYIEPLSFCSGYQYLSSNTAHARIYQISQGIWRIEWEDLPDNWPPDNDFDDLIVTVRLAGAYPDFKQNVGNWAADIYDHYTNLADNISIWGCAMATIANLMAYYGARDTNPGTLNTWMKLYGGFNQSGAVNWDSVNQYTPQGSDVTVIKWKGHIWRTDPNFQNRVSSSLASNWPVILQLNMPDSPSGIHFVVALTRTTESGQEYYTVKDPLTISNITSLSANDPRITRVTLYEPADGIARSSLMIYGHSPIAFLLVDNQGRRLGYDPMSGLEFREIPEGTYAYNAPFWNPLQTGSSRVGESLSLEVPDAAAGNYRLSIYGTGEGQFDIETYYRDGQSNLGKSTLSGTVQPATMTAYDIQADSGWVNIQAWRTLTMSSSAHSGENDQSFRLMAIT